MKKRQVSRGPRVDACTPSTGESILSFSFSECDQLNALLRHSDADIVQLRPGRFSNQLLLIPLEHTMVRYCRRATPWISTASALRGHVSVMLDLNYPGPLTVNGSLKDGDSTFDLYGGGAEHCAIALDPGEFAYIPVRRDLLEQVYWTVGQMEMPIADGQKATFRPRGDMFSLLRETVAVIRGLAESQPDRFAAPEARRNMERSLLTAIVLSTARDGLEGGSPHSQRRLAILRRAKDYLHDHEHEPVYLLDLCAATGTPARTLREVFMRHCGVGPLRYLKLRRLREVRAKLESASVLLTSVKAIALANGFWDLGRFAMDYRQFFGESPSATLARVSRK